MGISLSILFVCISTHLIGFDCIHKQPDESVFGGVGFAPDFSPPTRAVSMNTAARLGQKIWGASLPNSQFCRLFVYSDFDRFQYQLSYEHVERKIKDYLEKDPEIEKFYLLTPETLYIGDRESQRMDYALRLNHDALTSSHFQKRKGLKGARIAIDPGHFGGHLAELEERYIKIPAEKTKEGRAICFNEGDLTFLTALELKRLLGGEGAEVLITRPGLGQGALEEDFFTWLARHPDLKEKDSSLSNLFREHYNRDDLRKRAEKINAFSPDITVIIHYNAHLSESEKKARAFFTQSNYNLAFIPGAFTCPELKDTRDRYEFLRLIVTEDLEESLKLSRCIVQAFVDVLQVPLISPDEKTSYIDRFCLFQSSGVYCRNLALTRLVHGPVCYGETLIQNNEEEAYRLSSQDTHIMGYPCSNRVKQVAQAYFEGIKQYFSS